MCIFGTACAKGTKFRVAYPRCSPKHFISQSHCKTMYSISQEDGVSVTVLRLISVKSYIATYRKARNFRGKLIFVVFADSTKSTKFKYFTAHALINHLKCQLRYANNFSMCVYIRYYHTLKWLCLGRLVVTSLRNYLQMHLMFLSNGSLQDPFHVGAYFD